MTISEAKDFFISMGCSSFHMCREHPDRYKQYNALKISTSLEQQWVMESFSGIYEKVLSEQHSESLWCWHSDCEHYMHRLNSKEYFSKMLKLTRFVASKEVDGNRVVIAETINGRRDNKFRDGLIYGSYDCGMVEEAKEFAKTALWLAENDSEPVPNKNSWSKERTYKSQQKTKSILSDLNLLL